MTLDTTAPVAGRARTLTRLGVAGGLLGAAQAVALSVWPAAVTPDRWSYPLTPTGATVAQLTFAAQHLLLVAGLAGLLAVARGRPLRLGLWAALAGMLALTAMELVAIVAAAEPADSSPAQLVDGLYGIPTIWLGLALVVAGVAALRGGGPAPRWLLLGMGCYVFAVLIPALMGPFVLARLAIGLWMLLYAWLFARA